MSLDLLGSVRVGDLDVGDAQIYVDTGLSTGGDGSAYDEGGGGSVADDGDVLSPSKGRRGPARGASRRTAAMRRGSAVPTAGRSRVRPREVVGFGWSDVADAYRAVDKANPLDWGDAENAGRTALPVAAVVADAYAPGTGRLLESGGTQALDYAQGRGRFAKQPAPPKAPPKAPPPLVPPPTGAGQVDDSTSVEAIVAVALGVLSAIGLGIWAVMR